MTNTTKSISSFSTLLFLIGGMVALLGTYWDDAWHTDRGRDSFAIPPHLLLYGGVLLVGAAVVSWALLVFRHERSLCAVITHPPLALALVGDAVTLVSAPIDNAWHVAFGRDAVLWSPPHLLGMVGLLAVGSSMLLAVRQSPGRHNSLLIAAVGALVLSVSLIPVMEYEADVPQFAATWYLPVLTTGSIFTLALLRAAFSQRWIGTAAAALYTGFRVGVVVFLLLLGFSFPLIPPILLPAVVFDLTAQLRWSRALRALLFALAVYASYVPYLNVLQSGVSITFADIIGLPLSALVSWLVLTVVEAPHLRLRRVKASLLLLGCLLFLLPGRALAHDPGQGNEIGKAQLTATMQHATVRLSTRVTTLLQCDQLEPQTLIARRSGEARVASLHRTGDCQFQGEIQLPERGRWFVYAELTYHGQKVETWLPVIVGGASTQFVKLASLYELETVSGSAIEVVSSIVLYLLILALLATILLVFRQRFYGARQASEPTSA